MSHSPLPWGFMGQLIVSECDRKIAEVEFSDRMVDDRNLIVTAVNNHAKLVAAIERAIDELGYFDGLDANQLKQIIDDGIGVLREALGSVSNQDVAQP